MWHLRLLKPERGSAPVESIFSIVFVMLLALGVVQVAFTLYARNVIASAAHEGARTAIERGRPSTDAEEVVFITVTRAAGGLVEELDVATRLDVVGDRQTIRVRVTGSLRPFGVVPIDIGFDSVASASRPVEASR